MSAFGAKSRLSPYCFHTAHLSSARIGKFISILHQTTTPCRTTTTPTALFLISILHQTTTSVCSGIGSLGCFLFPFYIKPQPNVELYNRYLVLFLISILHQTTTSDMRFVDCHSVMWPNERYERRMTGQGSRNDAGFEYIYFYW